MATYQVTAPDGSSYEVTGDADKVQATIQSIVSPSRQPESGIMSAFRGMANQMPLGQQFSAAVSPGSYSDNMAAQNAQTQSDKAANPVAYGAGAVTGAVAPAFIPGVGEAMAANPMTAGAIMGGTGAIANTDVTKQPLQAAGQAAMGAGTGALLSGLISKMLPTPATLESKANTLANKSINMPAGNLVDMTPEEQQAQGAFLRSQGMVGTDKAKVLDKAKNLMDEYGQKIGSIGQGMTKKGLTVDDVGMLTQPLVDKAEKFALLEDPEANSLYKTYMAGAKAIASKGENPSWSDLQGLKETYGALAFKSTGEVKNQAAADVYGTLSNALKNIADKASTNPDIAPEYRQALAGYSRMAPMVSGLEKSVDADLRGASGNAGVGFHPMRMLASMPRPVRAVGGTIAALTGHPMIAAAAALPEAMNPAIQSNVAGGLANAMPTIQNVLNQAGTNTATSPEAQAKVSDLINMLKQKFADRQIQKGK